MEILITEKEIKDVTARIAKEISALKLDDLVLLFVLKGGMYFGVDLSREITTPHEVCTIRTSKVMLELKVEKLHFQVFRKKIC